MRLAWLLILRTFQTLKLGGGDGGAVVLVLATECTTGSILSPFSVVPPLHLQLGLSQERLIDDDCGKLES